MTTEELLLQARAVLADLEILRQNLERSDYRPGVKSTLARDLTESEARVEAVIEACARTPYAAA